MAGLFMVLLIAAACFSVERVLFSDSAFVLFRIINSGSLQIQEHRYGSFITQSFPLLASRLHLPLKAVMVLYSISFNLFYLTVALLLLYKFRDFTLGVLMGFYFLLFASDTFYWMNNEVHQGIAWMFLLFAFTREFGRKTTKLLVALPVFTVLSFLTLYTHPLLLFPTSFLWLFFVAHKEWTYSRLQTLLFSAVLLAIAASKLWLSTSEGSFYDAEKLQGITHFSWQKLTNDLRTPFTIEFLRRTVWNYWLLPVLLITGVWMAWRQKMYVAVLLTGIFAAVYFLALCLTFNDFLPFYTESELMPLSIILTTLFVFYALPKLIPENQGIVLAAIFLLRLAYIHEASQKWVDRKEWIDRGLETMQKEHVSKAIVPLTQKISDTLQMTWGTPVESLMASALQGEKPQRTFVVCKPDSLSGKMPPDSTYMISSFELLKNASLNQRYFSFDTNTNYRTLVVPDKVEKPEAH